MIDRIKVPENMGVLVEQKIVWNRSQNGETSIS